MRPEPSHYHPRAEEEPETLASYVAAHWRGELPLASAIVVNLFFVSILFVVVFSVIAAVGAKANLRVLAGVLVFSTLLVVPGFAWQVVGATRCLVRRHRANQSVGPLFGGTVCLLLFVGTWAYFSVNNIVPWFSEQTLIALGDHNIPDLMIEVLPSGKEVEITGGLPAGAGARLRELLMHAPAVSILHVNNGGGRIREALQIADLVKARKMTTYVSLHCESAATLIFLAGKERYVAEGAKIGFHSAAFPGALGSDHFQLNKATREAMEAARIAPDFIEHALRTPSTTIWYPSIGDLVAANVATAVTQGQRFGISQTIAKDLKARGLAGFGTYYATLKSAAPVVYNEINDIYVAGVEAGLSEAELGNRARNVVTAKMMASIPYTSDDSLRQLLNLWVTLLERYKDSNPREVLILFGDSVSGASSDFNPMRVLKNYPIDTEAEVTAEILHGVSNLPRHVDRAAAEADLSFIGRLIRDTQEHRANVEVMSQASADPRSRVAGYCLFYNAIKAEIPASRQGNLLRYLLTSEEARAASTAK